MQTKIVMAMVAASIALSGCAAPLVKPGPFVLQRKQAHASDWKHLARATARDLRVSQKAALPTVYVAPGPADMPFAAAYRDFLEAELMREGFSVVRSSPGAVTLNFEVKTYLYGGAFGNQKRLVNYATLYSTIGGLGAEMRQMNSAETLIAEGLAAGPLLDLLASLNETTRAEALLTVSVVGGDRVHYLSTETMYIHPTDIPFYMTQLPPVAPQSMTSAPLDVVPLRVTSR